MSGADDNQRDLRIKWSELVAQAANSLLAAQVVASQMPGADDTGSRHKATKRSVASILRLLDSFTK